MYRTFISFFADELYEYIDPEDVIANRQMPNSQRSMSFGDANYGMHQLVILPVIFEILLNKTRSEIYCH